MSQPILKLEKLSIGFKQKTIINELTISINAGELIALAGPNGGGKTTLLKTIGGLLPPLRGRILLDGKAPSTMSKRERAEQISFLFQSASSDWPFTVEELIAQGRFPYQGLFRADTASDQKSIAQAIQSAGLTGYEQRRVTELSGGEFQRVLIARSMAQEAKLLLLDEPANNLDPKYQYMVMNLVRSMTNAGQTALVSIHDLNLASLYADRIILLTKGNVAAIGTPAEALRENILQEVFGIPLVISPHPQNAYFKSISFPSPPK
ncbi:MAG: ABC transporter ATP-binding protein [Treponema sp.]|jgi:iron complex transport system ATP-binding protein|nr:ABC transporter ATP-binding protein [Treponema sp.]